MSINNITQIDYNLLKSELFDRKNLDPDDEERYYKRLQELASDIKCPVPCMKLATQVVDGKSRIVSSREQRSHTWVRNFYNFITSQFSSTLCADSTFGDGKLSFKTTSGSIEYNTSRGYYNGTGPDASAGGTSYGILVGRGSGAFSFDNYAMSTLITHGTGTNQLSYSANLDITGSFITNTLFRRVFRRFFNNNSGASINVTEIGLVYCLDYLYTGGDVYVLICRDVLPSADAVPDGGQYKVEYTLEVTLPE